MKADGTIDKYKAILVIKVFKQREGLDYFDTYLPLTRITSIRMVLAIAALRNLEVHQMDVKMTFPNGDLGKVLYMNQPEGFMAPGLESKVCRLVKSLYGLRKAPKQRHQISPYHYSDDHGSKDEVEPVDNKMASYFASKASEVGYDSISLLEKWRETYGNAEFDYDPYDNDMYEGQKISDNLQSICDNFDINPWTLSKGDDDNFPSIVHFFLAFVPWLCGHNNRATAAMSVAC
ncbi:calcineurin B-like protein 4 [Tanacetum coccineum]